jgi:Ca2+-binding EF-hand superfamily protein
MKQQPFMNGCTAPKSTFDQLMQILLTHTHQGDEDATLEQAFRSIDVDEDGEISALFHAIS